MKEKNRFSNLLKHLMSVANLKNYVLAKELQYDESYISKWVTGSLLPTEKTSEKVFRDISRCIVASCTPESREALYSEYQVDQDRDLEDAIFDNLEAGYPVICVMGPGDFTTTGHFIVMTGIENGMIRINDPNSNANSQKLWNYDNIENQIRILWSIGE